MAASSSIPTNSPPPSIVTDSNCFLTALQDLLTSLGKELRVPTIGGTELNLHELFLKVSSMGEYEKYNFLCETAILYSLLYDFEKRYSGTVDILHAAASNQSDQPEPVRGVLVTVNIGKEQYKGMLYRATPKKRDPAAPKRFRTAYNFFFSEEYPKQKLFHSGKLCEITKRIAELWKSLNVVEKQVYHEKAKRDRERYRTEMDLYRKRIADVVPLQQLPTGPEMPLQQLQQEVPLQQQLPPEVPLQQQLPPEMEEQSLVDTALRL
ncbi:hypothetical protein PTKIN_Ptkin17bG0051400 [Pterospermum kingtungense]